MFKEEIKELELIKPLPDPGPINSFDRVKEYEKNYNFHFKEKLIKQDWTLKVFAISKFHLHDRNFYPEVFCRLVRTRELLEVVNTFHPAQV